MPSRLFGYFVGPNFFSLGYSVGPKFLLMGILWDRNVFLWVFRGCKRFPRWCFVAPELFLAVFLTEIISHRQKNADAKVV